MQYEQASGNQRSILPRRHSSRCSAFPRNALHQSTAASSWRSSSHSNLPHRRHVSRALARTLICPPPPPVKAGSPVGRGKGWDEAGRCGRRARVTGSAVAEVAARGGAGGETRKKVVVQDGDGGLRAAEAVSPTGRRGGGRGGSGGPRPRGGLLSPGRQIVCGAPGTYWSSSSGAASPRPCPSSHGPGTSGAPAFLYRARPQRPQLKREAADWPPASGGRRYDAALQGTLVPTFYGELETEFSCMT